MQKKLLLLSTALLSMPVIFSACKEIPVGISQAAFTDTTYTVSNIPDADPKKVLVEEFSGVQCVNCGPGGDLLESLATTTFADKLNIASIQSNNQAAPWENEPQNGYIINSNQDYRCEDAQNIALQLFGYEPSKPAMAADRLAHIGNVPDPSGTSDSIFGDQSKFQSMIQAALNNASPVNVSVTSTVQDNNQYRIDVKVTYTQDVSGKQAITVYALENDLQDWQYYPDSIHYTTLDHIFRKLISYVKGDEILSGQDTKTAGTVLERTYIFTIDPADAKEALWKPENMEIIAFVHKFGGDDKQVYQSAATKLVQ